jgi:hypothetical protein
MGLPGRDLTDPGSPRPPAWAKLEAEAMTKVYDRFLAVLAARFHRR